MSYILTFFVFVGLLVVAGFVSAMLNVPYLYTFGGAFLASLFAFGKMK